MVVAAGSYKKVLKEINPVLQIGKIDKIIGLVIESTGPRANIGDAPQYLHVKRTGSSRPRWSDSNPKGYCLCRLRI